MKGGNDASQDRVLMSNSSQKCETEKRKEVDKQRPCVVVFKWLSSQQECVDLKRSPSIGLLVEPSSIILFYLALSTSESGY